MNAALIQCTPSLLVDLESDLRGLDGGLGSASGADFSKSDEVAGAYAGTLGRWDRNREEIRSSLSRIADLVRAIREAFEGADRSLAAGLVGSTSTAGLASRERATSTANKPGVVSLGPVKQMPSGRAALAEAFYATTDPTRANEDEIEITRLDNGRWIVALPGVTDLSAGPSKWFSNDASDRAHVSDTAGPAILGSANEYAHRVQLAMQRAGVPSGAEVMLLGHSAGAYAAMDLARDDEFNRVGAGGSYHVNVTHVVAAGAETDWKDKGVPNRTNVLILNNTDDQVFQAENMVHADRSLTRPGHVEYEFTDGWKLNGIVPDVGHHPDHYAEVLQSAPDPRVSGWLTDAGAGYGGDGERFAVLVAPEDLR
jgi:hypothetical protein